MHSLGFHLYPDALAAPVLFPVGVARIPRAAGLYHRLCDPTEHGSRNAGYHAFDLLHCVLTDDIHVPFGVISTGQPLSADSGDMAVLRLLPVTACSCSRVSAFPAHLTPRHQVQVGNAMMNQHSRRCAPPCATASRRLFC